MPNCRHCGKVLSLAKIRVKFKNVNPKFFATLLFAASSLSAQNNNFQATNAAAAVKVETNAPPSNFQRAEATRAKCLQGRRIICGKILKILPGGLVVDSGYSDLLRTPLSKSWLIPGRVTASRGANLVEGREPESVCVGVVFLTDSPKALGGAKPKVYDYASLLAYPTGQCTYTSVGTVQKTVRRFSASLLKAVSLNFEAEKKSGAAPAAGTK
jgi:hypothetical protein